MLFAALRLRFASASWRSGPRVFSFEQAPSMCGPAPVSMRVVYVLEGKVIGQCMKRHRHQQFIRFLNVIDARVAKNKMVHVIVDNYAAHKHPKVLEWIENHPRFVFHFTPTSASWLNAVESFFAKLTKKRLKRGVFCSLQ